MRKKGVFPPLKTKGMRSSDPHFNYADTPLVHGGVPALLGGRITVSDLALKRGKSSAWVGCSTLQNGYGKHEPQKTHNTHTTTNMSGRRPLSSGYAPLSPWEGQSCPQFMELQLPYEFAQAASCWGCARCCWFAHLGWAK